MPVYIDVVMFLNFLVDFFLLLGTNRLCGHPPALWRAIFAAGLGGIYGGACLLPGFAFLGNFLWRVISLVCVSMIAFGCTLHAPRRGLVFAFLCLALGGLAAGMGNMDFWKLLGAAMGVFLLCRFGFGGRIGGKELIPVEVFCNEKHMRLTALRDTGNTLRDPVTGAPVLVVGAEVASELTGLTLQQLKSPVESIDALPGLRLIPYRAVGNAGGMLLALRFPKVKIGNWQGSSLVAFAPEGLRSDGEYQALTGGSV